MITAAERSKILRSWAGLSPVTPVYLVLMINGPGDTGSAIGEVANAGGYVRQPVTFGPVVLHPSPRRSEVSNSAIVTFPTPTAAWGTITHVALSYYSSHNGELHIASVLDQPLTISAGTALSFPVDSLKFAVLSDQV